MEKAPFRSSFRGHEQVQLKVVRRAGAAEYKDEGVVSIAAHRPAPSEEPALLM